MDNFYNYSFFLGANSSGTFSSFFDSLLTNKNITTLNILKGGPGCGKSSFMKRIATHFENKGCKIERIYCSSDPNSLDCVIVHDYKLAYVDGTAPHVLEPRYPAAVENYLDFSVYWDSDIIRSNSKDIINLTNEISCNFRFAFELIKSANSANNSVISQVIENTNLENIYDRAYGVCSRELPIVKNFVGTCYKRFLSAISPYGLVCPEKFDNHKIYRIYSSFGLSSYFMEKISSVALNRGYDVYNCYCPLDKNRLEHVIIPKLNLCFVTDHNEITFDNTAFRQIHLDKYINEQFLSSNRSEFKSILKTVDYLIKSACQKIGIAKSLHDDLEEFYINAMNFTAINNLFIETIEKYN